MRPLALKKRGEAQEQQRTNLALTMNVYEKNTMDSSEL
jgi:hypothetical protein